MPKKVLYAATRGSPPPHIYIKVSPLPWIQAVPILKVHLFLTTEDPLKTQQDVLLPPWPHPPPPPYSNIRAYLPQGSRQAETPTINSPRHRGLFVLLDRVLYCIQAFLEPRPLLTYHPMLSFCIFLSDWLNDRAKLLSFCFLDCRSFCLPLLQHQPSLPGTRLPAGFLMTGIAKAFDCRCGVVWLGNAGGVLQLLR